MGQGDGTRSDTAAHIARFLRQGGVARVFGMPGGENVRVVTAMAEAGIPFILTHHEATAAFMADATAFLTGRPAVAMSTLGPGAANLASGTMNAAIERSPIIAITADIDNTVRDRMTHQRLELNAIYGAFAKRSIRADPATIDDDLTGAWQLARTAPTGPVHFSISPQVARADAGPYRAQISDRPALPAADVAPARERVTRARRPVIVAGIGADQSEAAGALAVIAEAWAAPVVVTPKAKGILPEDHPLFAGTYSVYADKAVQGMLADADLILCAGVDGIDFVKPWRFETPVVSISAEPRPDAAYPISCFLHGDIAGTLATLQPLRAKNPEGEGWARDARQATDALLAAPGKVNDRVAPQTVLRALREVAKRDAIMTTDVGSHKLLIAQVWEAYEPRSYLVCNGLSAMGYGLAAAMAAKLVHPERQVLSVIGDGGLLMYAGELATLARLRLPLVITLFNDASLTLIRIRQEQEAAESAGTGTDFPGPDFAAITRAFGLTHMRIDRPEDAASVYRAALATDGPVIVEVPINADEYRRIGHA